MDSLGVLGALLEIPAKLLWWKRVVLGFRLIVGGKGDRFGRVEGNAVEDVEVRTATIRSKYTRATSAPSITIDAMVVKMAKRDSGKETRK